MRVFQVTPKVELSCDLAPMSLAQPCTDIPETALRRYCKSRRPVAVPDSEAVVVRRHLTSESSSKGLIDGGSGQQKFRRESKRFSYLEETNGMPACQIPGGAKRAKECPKI